MKIYKEEDKTAYGIGGDWLHLWIMDYRKSKIVDCNFSIELYSKLLPEFRRVYDLKLGKHKI